MYITKTIIYNFVEHMYERISINKTNIIYILLFSLLGVLAYLSLSSATNLNKDATILYGFLWGYVFFIVAFNILGLLIIKLSRWVGNYIMQRWKMALIYFCVGIVLLLFNYSLLVIAKILVGINDPFVFQNGGGKVLIVLWLLQLIIVGLLVINQSVVQNMHVQQEAARLQDENNKAKYVALQSQLNPHFLFNNLNTLIAEIEYDPVNAVKFTRELSDAYRYVLQNQDKILISLSQEVSFAKSYIFLHRVRIGGYISIESNIDNECHHISIPPLTLQLLIENVIKHNVISENNPMKISIHLLNDYLIVTNTLNEKNVKASLGTGLSNLSNRCELIMRKKIIIEKNENQFIVKIPVAYE
jgi:sensor histidine kinase YesM